MRWSGNFSGNHLLLRLVFSVDFERVTVITSIFYKCLVLFLFVLYLLSHLADVEIASIVGLKAG